MRKSCLKCGVKHIGQAIVLMNESLQGYPHHRLLAIGHLAEAADELILDYPDIAFTVRSIRLQILDLDFNTVATDLDDLMRQIDYKQRCAVSSRLPWVPTTDSITDEEKLS